MIVSGYTMHLYCDDEKHEGFQSSISGQKVRINGKWEQLQDEFAGKTEQDCRKQAKAIGWVFLRGKRVICPICAKRD